MSSDQSRFATTHWSIIRAAGEDSSPESKLALEQLCAAYWYPLYAFIRRRGYQASEAQDLTQSFFLELLSQDRLRKADQDRGRFRTFLLAALNNFVANDWRSQQALKRGGNKATLSLNFDLGEERYGREVSAAITPETEFERQWALTLLERSVEQVRQEYVESGKQTQFDLLKAHLGGDLERVPYQEIAERLEMTEGAVKVAAYRLKERCRLQLRNEIAQTVEDQAEIDEELGHLFATLERS